MYTRTATYSPDVVFFFESKEKNASASKKCKDYSTFGGETPGRKFNTTASDFGFNGKREDPELYGEGNSYDFGARLYDPRLGRWNAVDPLQKKYPGISPYSFVFNNPTIFKDADGRDGVLTILRNKNGKGGSITLETTVHLYGKDASIEAASDANNWFAGLNNGAIYTDPLTGERWNVVINVTYVFDIVLNSYYSCLNETPPVAWDYPDKPNFIPEGDNIILIDAKLPGVKVAKTKDLGANTAKSAYSNSVILGHETGHLLGFDERYKMGGLFNLNGDIMAGGNAGERIDPLHFDDLANRAIKILGEMKQITTVIKEGFHFDDTKMTSKEAIMDGGSKNISNLHKEKPKAKKIDYGKSKYIQNYKK